ncbi:hypothetical protein ACN47E_006094 [Coniothyrium glycines]
MHNVVAHAQWGFSHSRLLPLVILLVLTNIGMLWRPVHTHCPTQSQSPLSTTFEIDLAPIHKSTTPVPSSSGQVYHDLAQVERLPTAYVPFYWHTAWGNPNASDADALWDNMNTAHGHIAVDHDWAATNNWTLSMDVPGKPGKGLYLLQAYHQLHCLRIVRSTLLSLSRKSPVQYPMHHALHCFDALRQHIICHADNTPLYGHGDGMAGDGQMHECKDWNALRNYATENTACFRDGQPGMSLEDRFNHCDDGTDGVEQTAPGV